MTFSQNTNIGGDVAMPYEVLSRDMSNFNHSSSKKPFWKRSSAKTPGSASASPSSKSAIDEPQHSAPRHKLTFKEFENHTEDAWDATDDDLLRTALAKIEMGVSPDQVQATAQAVIDHHTKTKSMPQKFQSQSITTTANNTPISIDPNAAINSAVKAPPSITSSKQALSTTRRFPGGATRTTSNSLPDSSPESSTSKPHSKVDSSSYQDNGHEKSTVQSSEKIIKEDGDTKHPSDNNKTGISLCPPDLEKAGSAPKAQSIRMPMQASNSHKEKSRIEKFHQLIDSNSTDLGDLRELSWPGIPSAVRAITWQLLSGYLPANRDRRETVLARKRREYFNFVEEYYEARDQPIYQTTFHQIHIDIPRTNPLIPLFQQSVVQNIFERLLFVWAVRHPASGYVQGINDLVTPFFVVFLTAQIGEDCDVETYDVSTMSESILQNMEADTYWCMGNLLDGIQDNYTFAQPGVQTKVNKLRELTKRVDAELHAHLNDTQIEYLQFSFRWMNNLLMREIPLRCTIRLWDTYLAENEGFSDFHLYVCAAFLKHWRNQLLSENDFQGVMLMIQNVPTHHWGEEEIKFILAEAFRLKYTFADAPSHLPHKR